ncbi:MAG: hypothetical protein ACI9G1_003817 [Pirellulaceae bacterium]|jgi:hypothetical protein
MNFAWSGQIVTTLDSLPPRDLRFNGIWPSRADHRFHKVLFRSLAHLLHYFIPDEHRFVHQVRLK